MRAFAWIRLIIALYFIGHNALVCIVTYDTFWMFLTNLTHLVCMVTYILLVAAHCSRGHYKKQDAGSLAMRDGDDVRHCDDKFWRLMSGLYEFSIHMLLTVFIAFWCVEFPASIYTKRDWMWGMPEWIGFFYSHTVPEIFVFTEFFLSRIRFEWRRIWIYILAGVLVLTMNIIVTLTLSQPYASMPWADHAGIAVIMATVIFII